MSEDESPMDDDGPTDDPDIGSGGSDGRGDPAASDETDKYDETDVSDGGVEDVDDLLADLEEPSGDLEDLFTEVETSDVDAEAVWEALDGDGRRSPGAGRGSTSLKEPSAADEAVVNKSSYCQGCEHFSGPPAMHCTNPGTDIVELVDVRHVLVRNCPVVERRRSPTVASLEAEDGDGDDPAGDTAATAAERSRRSDDAQ